MPLQNVKIFTKMLELGKLCTTDSNESIEERRRGGLRSHIIPDPKPKLLANNNYIILEGKENIIFTQLLNLISKEPEAEHLSVRDIEKFLYDFIFFVLDGNDNESKIKQKAKQIIKELLKQQTSWFVIAPINSMHSEIEINFNENNFIKQMQNDDFKKYFFDSKSSKKNFIENFNSKTCIFVSVLANNVDSALQKGKEKINELLDVLQFHFGDNYFYFIEKPNEFRSINKKDKAGKHNWVSNKKPICNIRKDKKEEITEFMDLIGMFVLQKSNFQINGNISTAIRWFSDAVKSENLEDKLSKYFIALESIFLPETLGNKGERLTYRITLLWARIQETFTLPDQILWAYERRSDIVHRGGSRFPLTESDISSIEYVTKISILHACKAIKNNDIKNQKKFILWLEQNDKIKNNLDKHFINYCSDNLKEFVLNLSKTKK